MRKYFTKWQLGEVAMALVFGLIIMYFAFHVAMAVYHKFFTMKTELFWICVPGFIALYGIIRMYKYELSQMFSPEERKEINKS